MFLFTKIDSIFVFVTKKYTMLVQLLSTEEREKINIKRLGRQHYVRIRIDGLRVFQILLLVLV